MSIQTTRLFLVTILVWGISAWAAAASLTGRILDPSGAAMPAVTVTIRDNTGIEQTAVTSSDGSYAFTDLSAGRYDILIHQPNFQPYQRNALDLSGRALNLRNHSPTRPPERSPDCG
jgi:protocatechuate 3,4-dioxygenase beta subunit